MNTARIVVLAIALVAGGLAAYLVASGPAPQAPTNVTIQSANTTDVLVAKGDIPLGTTLSEATLQWQAWPTESAGGAIIRRSERPDGIKQVSGMIARGTFIAGEPIREQKLVSATGSGFMAAMLPAGMRAVAIEITVESSAGGFILPNDRVDVIQVRREQVKKYGKGTETNSEIVIARVIIENVRILAIDQTIEEKDGQKVITGRTATIELNSNQTAPLARARQTGTITLALRSVADSSGANVMNTPLADEEMKVVRFGVASPVAIDGKPK